MALLGNEYCTFHANSPAEKTEKEKKIKDTNLSGSLEGDVGYVRAFILFAVARAFVIACLETPRDRTVPYFAASKKASTNKDEHRIDRRAAKDAAVTKLAMRSGSSVGAS